MRHLQFTKALANSLPVALLFIVWRLALAVIALLDNRLFAPDATFFGALRWANFDGVHYAAIARNGYSIYQQAFFPLYPFLMRVVSQTLRISAEQAGLIISHAATLSALVLFYRLMAKENKRYALRATVFLLLFPTSFFLVSVYTEGLFFLLSVAVFYGAKRRKWLAAGILGGLASATRIYGVFLFPALIISYLRSEKRKSLLDVFSLCLIPAGLIAYMAYLLYSTGDAFAFFHALPSFGTGRTAAIVWLPQVLWRYVRIFALVDPVSYVYAIALLEFSVFLFFSLLLLQAIRMRFDASYIVYSLAIIATPILTGTLTSLPRYVLSAFPLFFILASTDNKLVLFAAASVFALGLVVFTTAFLQGHFVA